MPPRIDLTGQMFGRWLVKGIGTQKSGGCYKWICECQCENKTIKEISSASLRNGVSKSCGCWKKEQEKARNFKDLTGQKFDRLLVIEKIDKEYSKNGQTRWKCLCDCGKYCERSTHTLLTINMYHSCGCYNMELLNKDIPDLTGKRFNKLLVIKETGQRNKHRKKLWLCQCDCGNQIIVPTTYLTSGHTSSCGCINYSIGEKHIVDILKLNNINFIKEYTNSELGKKRFDFAILNNKNKPIRFIEFDGRQHYTDMSGVWNSNETLEKIQSRDREKDQYAFSHNIPLVRIPYWERDKITLDMLLSDKYLVKENNNNV